MTDSSDHVYALSHQSRDALTSSIGTEWSLAREEAGKAAEFEISSLNRLRKIGIYFQEACNHQQINFKFFEKWKADYPETAKEISFESAKACITVARKLRGDVKTLNEMRRFRQTAFECFELSVPAVRTAVQHAREVNFRSEVMRLVAALERAIKDVLEDEGDAAKPWLVSITSKEWVNY